MDTALVDAVRPATRLQVKAYWSTLTDQPVMPLLKSPLVMALTG